MAVWRSGIYRVTLGGHMGKSEQRLGGRDENSEASVWEGVYQVEDTVYAKALQLELPGELPESKEARGAPLGMGKAIEGR